VGWLFRIDILKKHINKISSIKLNIWWDFLIKYFVPIILVLILIGDLYSEIKNPYGGYSWTSLILIGRDWLLLTLIVGLWISVRPWKTGNNKSQNRSDG
jgi:NSS family neurotransmitter:Na+ symporter